MSQLFESILLALASIWANKLRSMLTLLGNIVAVSSIITVVALITGVNAAVTDAIVSDLGADSFTIQRMGITQNEDEFERMRNNPLVTLDDALAVKRFATSVGVDHGAGADLDTRVVSRRRARDAAGAGGQRGVPRLRDLRRRARADDHADRDQAQAPGHADRLGHRRSAVRRRGAARQDTSRSPACRSRWSASARKRARRSASRSTNSW